MPFPIILVVKVVAAAAGGGYLYKRYKKPPAMTPMRKKIFEAAMTTMKDPESLNKLADGYEAEGLTKEATDLRNRAKARALPPEHRLARREVFRKAMKSKNPDAILQLAAAMSQQGLTSNAAVLRRHAEKVRKANAIQASVPTSPAHGEEEELDNSTPYEDEEEAEEAEAEAVAVETETADGNGVPPEVAAALAGAPDISQEVIQEEVAAANVAPAAEEVVAEAVIPQE